MSLKTSHIKSGHARYLVCSNHGRGYGCDEGRKNFRYDLLEAAVLDHVGELNLADFPSEERLDIEIGNLDKAVAELTIQLGDLHDRERRLALIAEEGGQGLDAVVELLKTRQAERQSIEAELSRTQSERLLIKARRTDPAMISDRISALRMGWEAATDDEARYASRAEAHAAIRQVVSLITFDSDCNAATLIVGNGLSTYQLRDGRIEDRCQVFGCFKLNSGRVEKDFA